ncbi:hypothetical protein PR001_g25271 [Phytophthora rubi]|uniref:Secreted peptide n=1 Tax=Phytophthora rubi TaxID=129364 RepID=A0A6A3I818_9STRA|nr:hypothetical protein PR001_g25271 [Phytophthora rubi]
MASIAIMLCCCASSSATASIATMLCCFASSSATAPMTSIAIILCCSTSRSATAPMSFIAIMLCCSASSNRSSVTDGVRRYDAALLPVLIVAALLRSLLSCNISNVVRMFTQVTLTQYRGINPLRVSIPHSSVFPV